VRTGENRTKFEGAFEVPNLSDENEIHEITITFSVEKSKGEKLKDMMRKDGEPLIREKLAEYVRRLKEEFSQGLILPTKSSTTTTNSKASSMSNTGVKPTPIASQSTASSSSSDIDTRTLTIHDMFKCPRSELFQTFTDINMVKAFTQNSITKYDCKQGGQFSLFGDNITGHFLDILPYDRIDMLWRFKSWPNEHYSQVSLRFEDDTEQTKLTIEQTGVPTQFYENTMVRQ
jgi:activator of HSP90 ATPase